MSDQERFGPEVPEEPADQTEFVLNPGHEPIFRRIALPLATSGIGIVEKKPEPGGDEVGLELGVLDKVEIGDLQFKLTVDDIDLCLEKILEVDKKKSERDLSMLEVIALLRHDHALTSEEINQVHAFLKQLNVYKAVYTIGHYDEEEAMEILNLKVSLDSYKVNEKIRSQIIELIFSSELGIDLGLAIKAYEAIYQELRTILSNFESSQDLFKMYFGDVIKFHTGEKSFTQDQIENLSERLGYFGNKTIRSLQKSKHIIDELVVIEDRFVEASEIIGALVKMEIGIVEQTDVTLTKLSSEERNEKKEVSYLPGLAFVDSKSIAAQSLVSFESLLEIADEMRVSMERVETINNSDEKLNKTNLHPSLVIELKKIYKATGF